MTALLPASPGPVIELEGIGRRFEGAAPVEVLHSVDLVVRRGDYLTVVGPSGSGKSTLLHLLGLLDRPSAGTYRLDGLDTGDMTEAERTAVRGANIGFVFQAFHLLPHRTVVENVELAELYNRSPRAARRDRAVEALERVGLGHRLDFMPMTLSGGERQRVAIARAIVSQPSVLLADEPTGNLDQDTSEQILALFAQLNADGFTLLVITHDLDVSRRAHRRIRLVDGTVVEEQM